MTIFDFNKRFPTEKSAIDFIIHVKYNGTYVCPFCGCVLKTFNCCIFPEKFSRKFFQFFKTDFQHLSTNVQNNI